MLFHVETHKFSTSIWGGSSRFTTQAMTWTDSFRTFIVYSPWTGSKTVRIWLKIEYCKSNNYQRNGNVAVPGLFIYSGGKQGGNDLDWRSWKKGLRPILGTLCHFWILVPRISRCGLCAIPDNLPYIKGIIRHNVPTAKRLCLHNFLAVQKIRALHWILAWSLTICHLNKINEWFFRARKNHSCLFLDNMPFEQINERFRFMTISPEIYLRR